MNLLTLATREIRSNPGQAILAVTLSAIAVAMLVVLLAFTEQMRERLQRDAEGIDLVVGAKGSPMQLILAGVFHLDAPPGNIPLAEVELLAKHPMVKETIPLALGDSFRGYRIVGAPTRYGELYHATPAQGRWGKEAMEAVLGAEVAQQSGLTVGETFSGSHGLNEGGESHADLAYTIVGILSPTGGIIDRLILTPVESVWQIHADHAHAEEEPDQPEISLALLQYATPLAAIGLPRLIQENSTLMAASPALEIARLMRLLGVGKEILQGFAWLISLAAAGTLLVGLLADQRHRRYELAIFRLLGASRFTLWASVMLDAWLLSTLGTLTGLLLGHGFIGILGWWLTTRHQPALDGWQWMPEEALLLLLAWLVAWLAAAWPAWRVSRLDVAQVLAER